MTKKRISPTATTSRNPTEDCGFFHAVSLSGGKDSTALLLLMIERNMPIDLVLSADTGMEFPEMYDHLAKVDDYLYRERGLHITTLRHPQGFEWLMFEQPKVKQSSIENRLRLGVPLYGNGWPGMMVRWCTGQLKTKLIDKEVKRLGAAHNALHYVGIAADEAQRCKKEVYPLVEWGITEAEALQICYDRGFDFGGLYEIYHRASCWCCPLQRIDELRKLRRHHPALWARLMDMDNRARAMFGAGPLGQFKKNWSVERLEQRFAQEDSERT
ncbi:phosphoadenosine phosphosulfate reductase family protein [Oscillospiraceae bacterium OttesenSCG-928-G22]|nr:phosphoadenosine phosphosulfate reductase family protein [Oscillospiraceae bacterium OttesenSCG-928-G22]